MKNLIIILLIFLSLGVYIHIQISIPYINQVKINSDKLKTPLKITQISDMHNNKKLDFDKLITEIEKFNPDFIFLTGDIIDRNTKDFSYIIASLKDLYRVNSNIYFISGNHELDNRGSKEFLKGLKDIGIGVLDDDYIGINKEGNLIGIIGLKFNFNESTYKELCKKQVKEDFNIVLSHSPDRFIPNLNGDEDLVLSGHTHGGQVRLPIIGGIVAPEQGFFPALDKGLYRFGRTILNIDSGLGNSNINLRLFNRIQVSNIIVEKGDLS